MVYVHVPFCRSFCTYCDFYSEIACRSKDSAVFERYTGEVCAEALARRDEILSTSAVNTLYIGGGTPSVLPLRCIERIATCIPGAPFTEFTVEVNPEDIVEKGREYVKGLLSIGVNRVSMGIQSLDAQVLKWMNRRHSADGARKAFAILRESGVRNISVDLIFGMSVLSDEVLEKTLNEILDWRPEHISAYQLSIEEGSALARLVEEGKYTEPAEEECRRQYDFICASLSSVGYRHYEISNWALPGHEAFHNSSYWTRRPYVGLGPGAHSLRGNDVRLWNSSTLEGWSPEEEKLSPEEIREERIMLGLRTAEGVDGKRIPEEDWFVSDSIIADMI